VAPVSFLAFAPRNFTDPITAREEGDFTMRAVAALVKFVLVPLLLVYTAILYAYAIKIVLAWELPTGTLGSMVVDYLLVGAATLLLGYPVRETGGTLVRLFWRYWVWLAALPVVLLFIAVSRRIGDYGLTEDRYLMVLVGVWALILAAIRVLRGGDFDLRLVPGVLALLLLAASFGPGGMIGFSILSQKA
jgi:phosphoglycerol transferase MdoB-like AlkP superfamily enzyme